MYNYPLNSSSETRVDDSGVLIVAFARGDVSGDLTPDNVYLTGIRSADSPFIQNITLVIQDGRTGMLNKVELETNQGYNPTLFLGDFTGDKVNDILISIVSGGSGGIMYYYIYSDINNVPKKIFDYNEFNNAYTYEVTYKNYYLVEVISVFQKLKFILDITYKGKQYLAEIYDRNGKLKAPIKGFVNALSGLYPVDFDANGVYELLGYQKIAGRYNADGLGYIQTSLNWNGQGFTSFDQNIAVPGGKLSSY